MILHKLEGALFRLGIISDDYIMRRNIIDSMDWDYEKTLEYWNDENNKVHGEDNNVHKSAPSDVMEYYANHIAEVISLNSEDILLSVGCGDGHIDSYLQDKCKNIYGFDFANTKIAEAYKRNPRGKYSVQSFLDRYHRPPRSGY